jgi:hypothetical protein
MKKRSSILLLKKRQGAELESVRNSMSTSAWLERACAREAAEALVADVTAELSRADMLVQRLQQRV